jgi:hypothetical protein
MCATVSMTRLRYSERDPLRRIYSLAILTACLCRRFFVARSRKPEAAFAQIKDAVDLRNSVDHLATYETIDVEEYETIRRLVSFLPPRLLIQLTINLVSPLDWPP